MSSVFVFIVDGSIHVEPSALKLVGGVPALDFLLERLNASLSVPVDNIFIITKSVIYTRWLQSYGNVRHLSDSTFICLDTIEGRHSASDCFTKIALHNLLLIDSSYLFCEENVVPATSDESNGCIYIKGDATVAIALPAKFSSNLHELLVQNNNLISGVTANNESVLNHVSASICSQICVKNELSGAVFALSDAEQFTLANNFVHEKILGDVQVLPERVEECCYARVGLIGNPSDGFQGKTVSFLIENFSARVCLEERPWGQGIEIVEPLVFSRLDELQLHSTNIGYTNGSRLLQATCKVFSAYCFKAGVTVHMKRCFRMTYSTDIPRMVGLSGSSAIIVATFNGLLRFYGLTIARLNIAKEEFPQVVLDIERLELGISAGLQDRVIQTYGGLVHMDFSPADTTTATTTTTTDADTVKQLKDRYRPLDPALLPPMYLAYDAFAGGDSGKVHSSVKDRWASRDPELVSGMRALGQLADQARDCLLGGQAAQLAKLMEKNFAIRRQLYGDAVVGAKNIRMVELAAKFGLSAKFTGSGGALLCIRSDGLGWLDGATELEASQEYARHGFNFIRIAIPVPHIE